jgi:hypothetical protein
MERSVLLGVVDRQMPQKTKAIGLAPTVPISDSLAALGAKRCVVDGFTLTQNTCNSPKHLLHLLIEAFIPMRPPVQGLGLSQPSVPFTVSRPISYYTLICCYPIHSSIHSCQSYCDVEREPARDPKSTINRNGPLHQSPTINQHPPLPLC